MISMMLFTATIVSYGAARVNSKKSSKPITIRYTSYLLDSAQAGNAYLKEIQEFEKLNPDIKIETDFIQNSDYTAGVKTRLLGGEQMDVFDTWSPSLFSEFRKLGDDVYLDLSDLSIMKQFNPNTLKSVTINGKIYAAPELLHSDGILYNKTLFDQLKIKAPTNWSEFLKICEKLKKNNIIPLSMDGEWYVPQFFWGSAMPDLGAKPDYASKLEAGTIKTTDKILVTAINKLKSLIDKGYIPKDWAGMKHEQSKDLLGQGKAAMMVTGTWDIPSVQDRNKKIDVEFMNVPANDKGTPIPNINVGCLRVINSKTQYPEQAKKFVSFLNSKQQLMNLSLSTKGALPFTNASVNEPTVKKIAAVVNAKNAVIFFPHTVSVESLQVKILNGINSILEGADEAKTLAQMKKDIDDARNNK